MEHILDNPIWNGLNTGNKKLSKGNDQAKFFSPDVSASAGLKENDENSLRLLYQLLPFKRVVTLFSDRTIPIGEEWHVIDNRMLFQMIYNGTAKTVKPVPEVKELNDMHIPFMMELVKLTKPGAFFERTIDFGNYKGIFSNNQLIAMAGYRFQPCPYVEISAVCTHPDHLGRGHAGLVISSLINDIINQSGIPYLHVSTQNISALKLYEKLGFITRKKLNLYTLQKVNDIHSLH